MRSQCAEMKRNSCSTQLGKACMQQRRPSAAKKKKTNKKKNKKTKQNKKETLGTKLVMENAMGWGLGDLSSSLWASLEHL